MDSYTLQHVHEEAQLVLNVEGMTCAHCAQTVNKVLQNSGAHNPSVNFATGEASFLLPDATALDAIIQGIGKAGYKVLSTKELALKQEKVSSLEKKFFFTIPFTVVLFFSHMFFSHDFFLNNPWVQLMLCIPVFIIGLTYFGKSAWSSLKVGAPNMDVLIMIGSASAFIYSIAGTFLYLGTQEIHNFLFYETTATIITLVLLGNVIEHRSIKQTTTAIGELTKLQTALARKIILQEGKEIISEIQTSEVQKGDVLLVNTGDKIPVDGSVLSGTFLVDESMITGESIPVNKQIGDKVIGGTIVIDGSVKILAEKIGKDTILSKIIELVKNAQQSKPSIQKLGDKVSNIFVPAVLLIAALTFVISYFAIHISAQQALMNSIAVLVISCPCAMGLATPTAVMVGIGRAAKKGILIKGGSSLEEFAKAQSIVFDKTGTLTTGNFKINNIHIVGEIKREEVEALLYQIEQHSSHPIAKSIVNELKNKSHSPISLLEVKENKGTGMSAKTNDGILWQVGSYRVAAHLTKDDFHSLYILRNESLVGMIDLVDEIKIQAKETIHFFKYQGIEPIMVSGDKKNRCDEMAHTLAIDKVYSEQLPEQKLKLIDSFSAQGHTAMVGDGINDAPALAKASVGISIGNASQVAIHSAQIVLLNEKDLSQLQTAYLISKHTLKTIKQNLFWAFFYNVVAIPIAAAGFLSPMIGALTMAFSDVVVIGNSIRLKYKKLL